MHRETRPGQRQREAGRQGKLQSCLLHPPSPSTRTHVQDSDTDFQALAGTEELQGERVAAARTARLVCLPATALLITKTNYPARHVPEQICPAAHLARELQHLFLEDQSRVNRRSKLCPLFINYSYLFNDNNAPYYLSNSVTAVG